MGTTHQWSVDVTIEPLNRDVNVFVYQNVNVSLSNRAHQLGEGEGQTNQLLTGFHTEEEADF